MSTLRRRSGLTSPLVDLLEVLAVDTVEFGLVHLVQHQRAALAAWLAATALLLRFEAGE
jgi:hypothetical protein